VDVVLARVARDFDTANVETGRIAGAETIGTESNKQTKTCNFLQPERLQI
jgi:hypothetical protein